MSCPTEKSTGVKNTVLYARFHVHPDGSVGHCSRSILLERLLHIDRKTF